MFKYKRNIKMSSVKSSENIQKKECWSDRSVSDNQLIKSSDRNGVFTKKQ